MNDARTKAVEELAAIVLNAARSGHLHGSASAKVVADLYADEWPLVVAWARLVLDGLGLVAVPPELVEAAADARAKLAAFRRDDGTAEHTVATVHALYENEEQTTRALADAVLAQLGGKP